MNAHHERIEELLAGYSLLSLDGEDAAEADRLLAEHVPTCLLCRDALAGFQAVTGDLAIGSTPAAPPDLLLTRIHRGMDDVPLRGRPFRRGAFVAMAASVAALVAMGGLSLSLGSRVSRAEAQRGQVLEILSVMRSPGATPISLDPQGETPAQSAFVEVAAHDVRRLYVAGERCPEPAPGHAYQLWLGRAGIFVPVGEPFRPDAGLVLLELEVDVSAYDEVWITEERMGAQPSKPRSDGGMSWRATLSGG